MRVPLYLSTGALWALIDLAWYSAIVRLQVRVKMNLAYIAHSSSASPFSCIAAVRPDSTQATIIEERDWKFDVNAKSVTLRRCPCFGQTRLTYFQRLGLDTTYFLRLEVGTNPLLRQLVTVLGPGAELSVP
jgi:hypothetical protein